MVGSQERNENMDFGSYHPFSKQIRPITGIVFPSVYKSSDRYAAWILNDTSSGKVFLMKTEVTAGK
jgi:hypothetical protein